MAASITDTEGFVMPAFTAPTLTADGTMVDAYGLGSIAKRRIAAMGDAQATAYVAYLRAGDELTAWEDGAIGTVRNTDEHERSLRYRYETARSTYYAIGA